MESDTKRKERPPHPKEKASIFSILTFRYVLLENSVLNNLLTVREPQEVLLANKSVKMPVRKHQHK